MKNFLLILFLLCCFGAQAQEKDDFKRFGVGVSYTMVDLFYFTDFNSHSFRWKYFHVGENSNFVFQPGILLHYKFTQHFNIQLCLDYTLYNFTSDLIFDIFHPSYFFSTIKYSGNTFNIPVRCNYSFGPKKLHFNTGIGFNPFITRKHRLVLSVMDSNYQVTKTTSRSKFDSRFGVLQPYLALGIEYDFKPNYTIRLETVEKLFNFYFPIYIPNEMYLLHYSINFSLIYSFN